MIDLRIDTPPAPKGTEQEQLLQLYRYLFRLSEILNIALRDLSRADLSAARQEAGGNGKEKE